MTAPFHSIPESDVVLDEDEFLDKIPTKYRDLYDSEPFEKFRKSDKDWFDE